MVSDAEADAAATVARAKREAAAIREEARAQGAADAEALLVVERARARRQARALVLDAQHEVYQELRRQARQSAAALREDPAYPAMRARLAALARATLGADAIVTEAPGGGVVAESRGRGVLYSLAALADNALDMAGVELEGLWSA